MSRITIVVARDFSDTPGPRNKSDGEFSGEEFLHTTLRPAFIDARKQGTRLFVDLDGAEGYATSFLEESFGGLAREFGADVVAGILDLKSQEEPYLIAEVMRYIDNTRSDAHAGA